MIAQLTKGDLAILPNHVMKKTVCTLEMVSPIVEENVNPLTIIDGYGEKFIISNVKKIFKLANTLRLPQNPLGDFVQFIYVV